MVLLEVKQSFVTVSSVWSSNEVDRRAMWGAMLITVLVHGLMAVFLPQVLTVKVNLAKPVEVLVKPVSIPENRLPPSMRLAEANASANKQAPTATPLIAAQNQLAAQPIPEKVKTESVTPRSIGQDENQIKVVQAMPRPISVSEVSASEGKAGTASAKVGILPKKESISVSEKKSVEPSPEQRPQAIVPSGTTGLLLRNNVGVNRAGAVAISARFSNYGDYMQRMMEAIQSSWWSILEKSKFESVARGRVVIQFKMCRDGSVVDVEILRSEVPQILAFACKDAVQAPAPFDAWREDMVALFGEDDIVTITFHYL